MFFKTFQFPSIRTPRGIKISLGGFTNHNHPLVSSTRPSLFSSGKLCAPIFEFIRPSLLEHCGDQGRHKQFTPKLLSVNEFMRKIPLALFTWNCEEKVWTKLPQENWLNTVSFEVTILPLKLITWNQRNERKI